jgi:enoyl-CoA hydratase
VGKAAAMQMLLTGAPITTDDALKMGLVSTLCAEGQALEAALKLGHTISENSPTAIALAKNAALAALDTGLAQGLEHEKRNFHVAILSPDSYEGQQAFLEKRRPAFSQKGAST